MSDENKAVVRRFWEAFNSHNLDGWDEICSANFINHDPGLPTPHADLPTLKPMIGMLQTAFPDIKASEEDLISEGDRVVVRRIFRATHKSDFMGVAPSGKEVEFTGIFVSRLSGGKIEEHWAVFDALGLLQQIGAVPIP